jgi:N-acetyl-gamma-glutamyl-phosphate reductase
VVHLKAGIIGVTGYGGLELFRLLSAHPGIDHVLLYTSTKEGTALSDEAPHLKGLYDGRLRSIEQVGFDGLDVLFCSAPSGVSTELLPEFIESGLKMKVIDLAGDFRIKDTQTYRQWYSKEPPPPPALASAVYGLSEWNMQGINKANLISNPGCYPTAVLLGILPLLKDRLVDPDSLIIDAKSGVSGAGASPNKDAHFPKVNDSFSIYKINKHQHIPEIEQTIREMADVDTKITFSTHLVPMTRGIMATMYANVNEGVTKMDFKEILHEYYETKTFVRVFREKTDLFTKQVYGSNFCDLTFAYDERTNRVTVVSVIDNLMKGAAGQAVQNMNIMCGFTENTGLENVPLFP